MRSKRTYFILLLIVLLSSCLRIYKLREIPNSISADEAAFGYNAYSILKTGKDEFGKTYPLLFQSFDDYKNPLEVYALIPSLSIGGVTVWAIRLPSVVFGIGIVLMTFALSLRFIQSNKIALLTAFFAAISPWLIQYSRVAIDTNIGLFFLMLGVLFFFYRKKSTLFLLPYSLSLALAFWSYHSYRIWTVIFISTAAFYVGWTEKQNRIGTLIATCIFILLCLPYIYISQKENTFTRLTGISVFADKEIRNKEALFLKEDLEYKNIVGKLAHNRRLVFINQAVNGYLNILNPSILFSQNNQNQIPETRLFYLWQAPLIIAGFFALKKRKKLLLFLIGWIVIGFIPGAITTFPPFDRRILTINYPLLFLTALGLISIKEYVRKYSPRIKSLVNPLFMLVCIISLTMYLDYYFIHGRKTVIELWGNGMREVVGETKKEKTNYDKVIVSLKLNQPLIFFLFYEKYPPEKYLAEGGTISGGYLDERGKFDKYQFRNITPALYDKNTLYIWNTGENLPCLTIKNTILQTDQKPLAHLGTYDPNCIQ